ncbi:hypothetical protein FF011L_53660 [Roseimaritima multifibrata]|uniref:Prenyltransferase n=2 Tax=Roseimaritima multifibrata TaxID=1930274 RepID=A0A517MNV3_9BACT|nr:hypothetical protein FF011L_53660 [Roseimaritima multifibrata]
MNGMRRPWQKTLRTVEMDAASVDRCDFERRQHRPLRQATFIRLLQGPNLVSLDAPVVAVSWALLLSFVYLQPRPEKVAFASEWWPSLVALFGAVWLIYLTDRLLDCRRLNFDQEVPARHRFTQRWGIPLWRTWGAVLLLTGVVTLFCLERRLWVGGAALLGGVLLYGWTVHASARLRRGVPKEFIVAIIFAAGVGLPTLTVVRNRSVFLSLLSIACLFALNCLLVSRSQRHSDRQQQIGSAVLRFPWLASLLPWFACLVVILVSGLWAYEAVPGPVGLALVVSGVGLVGLSFCTWSVGALLADYVLLSPILVMVLFS